MSSEILGIDKGMLKAFALILLIVGSLTTFFLSEYISALILGTIYQISNNGSTITDTAITGESFQANNITAQQLANYPIVGGTLKVANSSGYQFAISNFTVTYDNATVLLKGGSQAINGSTLTANYTYRTITNNNLPVTTDTKTFLGTAEDDFVTTFTNVNTAVKFIAALITVVAVILVFIAFLPSRKKRKGDIDY